MTKVRLLSYLVLQFVHCDVGVDAGDIVDDEALLLLLGMRAKNLDHLVCFMYYQRAHQTLLLNPYVLTPKTSTLTSFNTLDRPNCLINQKINQTSQSTPLIPWDHHDPLRPPTRPPRALLDPLTTAFS